MTQEDLSQTLQYLTAKCEVVGRPGVIELPWDRSTPPAILKLPDGHYAYRTGVTYGPLGTRWQYKDGGEPHDVLVSMIREEEPTEVPTETPSESPGNQG